MKCRLPYVWSSRTDPSCDLRQDGPARFSGPQRWLRARVGGTGGVPGASGGADRCAHRQSRGATVRSWCARSAIYLAASREAQQETGASGVVQRTDGLRSRSAMRPLTHPLNSTKSTPQTSPRWAALFRIACPTRFLKIDPR
jgi:hypothetical protein